MRPALLVLVLAAIVPAEVAAQAAEKLVLLPVAGRIPKVTPKAVEEALLSAVSAAFEREVMAPKEASELLRPPQRKMLARCNKGPCIGTLAQALEATMLLHAQIIGPKAKLQVKLTLFSSDAEIAAKHQGPLDTKQPVDEALADLVYQLRAALPGATWTPASQPASSPPAEETAPPPDAPGWLGAQYGSVDEDIASEVGLGEPRGAYVKGVSPEGPAAAAGVQAGDVIVVYAGAVVKSAKQLNELLKVAKAGSTVALTLWRNKGEEHVQVTLAAKPPAGDTPPTP